MRSTLLALPVVAYLVWRTTRTVERPDSAIIPSPAGYVAALSDQEQRDLPYPPDALPGRRDVETPHGTIRAYEWGNEDGQKVLLVHGISTPCISLAGVAKNLAAKGYRVLLFDLFGRGYSGAPDPYYHPQNVQLFSSQIHFVLASSPLSWTGTSKFHMVGYSLGGGISLAFTSYFPDLVDSLVLIAPSGLIRQSRMALPSRIIYSGAIPGPIVRAMVRRRFGAGGVKQPGQQSANPEATAEKAMTAEIPDEDDTHPALKPDSSAPIFKDRPDISVADAVAWQVEHNQSFIPSFVSSIQNAPITEQHDTWRLVSQRLETQRANPQDKAAASKGLRHGKVLMLLGKTDEVIVGEDLAPDATELLGEAGLDIGWVEAGHDLPIVKPDDIANMIMKFWEQ